MLLRSVYQLRANSDEVPSMEEIEKEVEAVRKE